MVPRSNFAAWPRRRCAVCAGGMLALVALVGIAGCGGGGESEREPVAAPPAAIAGTWIEVADPAGDDWRRVGSLSIGNAQVVVRLSAGRPTVGRIATSAIDPALGAGRLVLDNGLELYLNHGRGMVPGSAAGQGLAAYLSVDVVDPRGDGEPVRRRLWSQEAVGWIESRLTGAALARTEPAEREPAQPIARAQRTRTASAQGSVMEGADAAGTGTTVAAAIAQPSEPRPDLVDLLGERAGDFHVPAARLDAAAAEHGSRRHDVVRQMRDRVVHIYQRAMHDRLVAAWAADGPARSNRLLRFDSMRRELGWFRDTCARWQDAPDRSEAYAITDDPAGDGMARGLSALCGPLREPLRTVAVRWDRELAPDPAAAERELARAVQAQRERVQRLLERAQASRGRARERCIRDAEVAFHDLQRFRSGTRAWLARL